MLPAPDLRIHTFNYRQPSTWMMLALPAFLHRLHRRRNTGCNMLGQIVLVIAIVWVSFGYAILGTALRALNLYRPACPDDELGHRAVAGERRGLV
jgi:hypothetical protein